MLVAALLSWLYHHFVTKGRSLDLNAMNTMLLTVALALHRSPAAFSRAIRGAVTVCWPVLVLYHLYGGVAGLLQFTSVGERLAGAFAAWSTPLTFTFLTAAASSIVAIFIPSSGGQWVVQGFVTSRAAAAVGTTAQHGLLAMSVGDHVGNMVSPFWPVLDRRHRPRRLPHLLWLRRRVRPRVVRARRCDLHVRLLTGRGATAASHRDGSRSATAANINPQTLRGRICELKVG